MQLAIDCASDEPGVALAVDGVAALVATWQTARNHSAELLPNIERLLAEAERDKSAIEAVFVDLGPGGYAALRVGVSTAKALAHGLGVPIAGIARLELDAWSVAADAGTRRIVAVHAAGRGDAAWAAYGRPLPPTPSPEGGGGVRREDWTELLPPRISKRDELHAALAPDDALTGDIDDALAEAAQRAGAVVLVPARHRVVALATLGHARLLAGRADDATSLVPLYLRAPAIGPQG